MYSVHSYKEGWRSLTPEQLLLDRPHSLWIILQLDRVNVVPNGVCCGGAGGLAHRCARLLNPLAAEDNVAKGYGNHKTATTTISDDRET